MPYRVLTLSPLVLDSATYRTGSSGDQRCAPGRWSVWVMVRSSPGLSSISCVAPATALPPFQGRIDCVRGEVTGLLCAFLRVVWVTTPEVAMRGATWTVWISGLSQKISDTESSMPGGHLIFS